MKKMIAIAAVIAAALGAARAQSIRQVPLGFCSMSSMSTATAITTSTCTLASFTGSGVGTTLTVSAVTGLISPADLIVGTGVPTGTVILSQIFPLLPNEVAGGAGRYVTSNSTTSSSASLTAGGVPGAATYAILCAYTQNVNYRDDGVAPTGTTGTGGQTIAAGNCVPYNGTFSALQFIQQVSGAILGASFYK